MLALNKLGLQLGLIDEENIWEVQPGANQDYIIISNDLMQVQVVRDTENTYDIAMTPDSRIDKLWDRPKKTKLLIKANARTLVQLADIILKRMVAPHKPALQKAMASYAHEVMVTRLANEGLSPFIQRHKIDEENVVWAGVGNHVASFFMDDPEAAVHIISRADDVREGQIKISHLTMDELEEMIKALKLIGTKRWMRGIQSMTPSETEESSPVDTASSTLERETSQAGSLEEDLQSSTS